MVADLLPIRFFPMKLSHVGFKHLELIVWVLSNVLLTVSFVQACPFILKIRGLLSDASPKDFAAEVEKGLCWFHSSCESSLGAVCIHTCDTYVYIYIYKYIYMFIYLYIYTFFMSVNMLLHGFKAVCLQRKDIPFTFPASFISPSFGNPSGWVIFHVVIWCCSWKNMWPWQDGKDVVGFCSWSTEFWFEYDEHRRRCWQTHHLIWIKLHVQPDVNHNHKILLSRTIFCQVFCLSQVYQNLLTFILDLQMLPGLLMVYYSYLCVIELDGPCGKDMGETANMMENVQWN